MNTITFDIETGTNKNAEMFMPDFKAPRTTSKGEADKRDKPIEEQKAEWLEKTALSALTGRILCIGVKTNYETGLEKEIVYDNPEEDKVINHFWEDFIYLYNTSNFVGHNILSFDIPFICRRSLINGIKIPKQVMNGRYLNDCFKDTMNIWNFNQYPKEYISLNNLAKALGIGRKVTEDSKNFGKLWNEDRDKAIAHVKNDIQLTYEIYNRIK